MANINDLLSGSITYVLFLGTVMFLSIGIHVLLCRLFKIDHDHAHRASDDAIATAKLLAVYLEIFQAKGLKKVNPFQAIQNLSDYLNRP